MKHNKSISKNAIVNGKWIISDHYQEEKKNTVIVYIKFIK